MTPKEIGQGKTASQPDFHKIIESLNAEKKEQDAQKFNKIKAKVLTMGRMAVMLKNIKENKELIQHAKNVLNTDKLPPGLLGSNSEELKNQIDHFIKKYKTDMNNEKFPVKEFQRRQSQLEMA